MITEGMASDEADAVELGRMLGAEGIIAHVVRDHEFCNKPLFFRFVEDEGHGALGICPRPGHGCTAWLAYFPDPPYVADPPWLTCPICTAAAITGPRPGWPPG